MQFNRRNFLHTSASFLASLGIVPLVRAEPEPEVEASTTYETYEWVEHPGYLVPLGRQNGA